MERSWRGQKKKKKTDQKVLCEVGMEDSAWCYIGLEKESLERKTYLPLNKGSDEGRVLSRSRVERDKSEVGNVICQEGEEAGAPKPGHICGTNEKRSKDTRVNSKQKAGQGKNNF